MSESILQNGKASLLSGKIFSDNGWPLEKHHIYFGNPERRFSEAHGCWCWLTQEEHRGTKGVHNNRLLDLDLKRRCQRRFEETHTREEFMCIFMRNYL